MPTPHADAAAALVVAIIAEQIAFSLEENDGEGYVLIGSSLRLLSWGNNAEGVICWEDEMGGPVLFEAPTVEEMAAWLALQ